MSKKNYKRFTLILACCFICSFLSYSALAQEISLSDVKAPCNGSVEMPVTLTTGGVEIAGVSIDITFDPQYLEFVECTIGPAGEDVGKNVSCNEVDTGVVRVGVFNEGNVDPIGDGILAYVRFDIVQNPASGTDLENDCSASDPAGDQVAISCSSGSVGTAKIGDLDLDGTVTIAELTTVVMMFLGIVPVDPIADSGGDGECQIYDVIKVINCFLETPDCYCPPEVEVPYEELWASSGHADTSSEAFNHWNDDGEISTSCAKCHSTPGFLDFLGADGTASGVVDNPAPIGTVITCTACHNEKAAALDSVTFPSGLEITGLGAEARCMQCHQGRQSTVSVNEHIVSADPADDDTVDPDLRFRNVHYFAAGATMYGTFAQGGYEYDGKDYDAKFAHVEGYDVCMDCHNEHSLEVKVEECAVCHTNVVGEEDLVDIRMYGSLVDYDGDGDITEGVYYEIEGLQEKLYQAIRAYATTVAGTDIAYDAHSYPYFFVDDNNNGIVDLGETTGYASWTARLVKAAYNYQFSMKDPGAFAHGGKYIIELLYDSIDDLNSVLITPVDMTGTSRTDEGHFDGSAEAWRHWDDDGEVSDSCAKCHSGKGLPFFLEYDISIDEPISNGMLCLNCHEDFSSYDRRSVGDVTFPSGLDADLGDDSNLCMLCHQGREAKATVDEDLAADPGPYSFINVHYLPVAATFLGTDVQGGYEYDGKLYAGQNPFTSHGGLFNTCVECHMGTEGFPGNSSHNLSSPNPYNCVCHYLDVPQGPDFAFENIRKGTDDYDGDSNVIESLKDEIEGLQAALYTEIQSYATGLGYPIVYATSYPYFVHDTNGNGVADEDEISRSNRYDQFDAKLLRAAYNYQFNKKEPAGYIHNVEYIAQLLIDSIQDLNPAACSTCIRP